MMVMTPRPPIWIKTRITTWPKVLQVDTVVTVTRPVTQVAVVAVNRASRYGTGLPSAALMGRASRRLPIKIIPRKLSMIICVVVSRIGIDFLITSLTSYPRWERFIRGYYNPCTANLQPPANGKQSGNSQFVPGCRTRSMKGKKLRIWNYSISLNLCNTPRCFPVYRYKRQLAAHLIP